MSEDTSTSKKEDKIFGMSYGKAGLALGATALLIALGVGFREIGRIRKEGGFGLFKQAGEAMLQQQLQAQAQAEAEAQAQAEQPAPSSRVQVQDFPPQVTMEHEETEEPKPRKKLMGLSPFGFNVAT